MNRSTSSPHPQSAPRGVAEGERSERSAGKEHKSEPWVSPRRRSSSPLPSNPRARCIQGGGRPAAVLARPTDGSPTGLDPRRDVAPGRAAARVARGAAHDRPATALGPRVDARVGPALAVLPRPGLRDEFTAWRPAPELERPRADDRRASRALPAQLLARGETPPGRGTRSGASSGRPTP